MATRTDMLRMACYRLVTGTSNEVPIGKVDVPVEFLGKGQSLDRPWRGLTNRLWSRFQKEGPGILSDDVNAAVLAVFLTSSAPGCFSQEGDLASLKLGIDAAREARQLYRDRRELEARLRERIATKSRGPYRRRTP